MMRQWYGCLQWWSGVVYLFLLFSSSSQAAVLENPALGSFKSGADSVFGWKCSAGTLTARFDGGDPIPIVYGSTRGDTLSACGDDDNGYVLLWNWGLLSPGEHLIEVFDDGVMFATATFTVVTTGVEFLSSDAICTIPNFPAEGDVSRVNWADTTQRFELSEVLLAGPSGAPQVTGKWLAVLDFASEDCNWNTGPPPALRSRSEPFDITQQGSALSGSAPDSALSITGIVEPDEDFLIATETVSEEVEPGCVLRQAFTLDGNFLTGDLTLTQNLDISGSCDDRNDCTWDFIGTIDLLSGKSTLLAKEAGEAGKTGAGLLRDLLNEAQQTP